MNAIQLDFMDSEMDILHREIKANHERVENVRKGMFKRHHELERLYLDLQQEIQTLKDEIKLQIQNIK